MAAKSDWSVALHSTSKGKAAGDEEAGKGGARGAAGPGGITVAEGRPDIRAAIARAFSEGGAQPHEVAVIACGPEALVAEAELAAGAAGCAFHKELFAS